MSTEDDFSTYVLDKAGAVPLADIRQHESDPSVWFVKSARTGAEHRVQFVEDWVLCTCQHGDIKVSTSKCYHAAAALLTSAGKHPEQDEEER